MRLFPLLALALAAPGFAQAPAPAPAAAEAPIVAEARSFMAGYERDLIAGDRAAIAARHDRRGAWRLGQGEKSFLSWEAIRAHYAGPRWGPPSGFVWRELSYEPAGPDSVVVIGLFDWGAGEGRLPVTYSYTGLLVRQDGELRIRLEDESARR
ncbi:MAG TPA: hypothetical protein VEW71_08640 [Allosphingosinicella sp.]|nr:hypothetical protein [Allosphingosinicella sp.]